MPAVRSLDPKSYVLASSQSLCPLYPLLVAGATSSSPPTTWGAVPEPHLEGAGGRASASPVHCPVPQMLEANPDIGSHGHFRGPLHSVLASRQDSLCLC